MVVDPGKYNIQKNYYDDDTRKWVEIVRKIYFEAF